MKTWSQICATLIVVFTFCLTAQAAVTVTYRQGVSGYTGAKSVTTYKNNHVSTAETQYMRFDGYERYYNFVYFGDIDMSLWGPVTSATLTLYKSSAYVITGGEVWLRRINDPDNLGMWTVSATSGNGVAADVIYRDDATDLKWQLSDTQTDTDNLINVLKATNACPSFIVNGSDPVGTAYVLDVTEDVEAWRSGITPNQGWATFHEPDARIQNNIATKNNPVETYRPLLTVTYETGSTDYTLTVVNGTGSGDYPAGTAVNIVADNPAAGQLFHSWTGDVSNVSDIYATDTIITMPAADTSIGAHYVDSYILTVANGNGDGEYAEGTVVDITADDPSAGYVFHSWTGDVSNVSDIYASETTITMPAADTSIGANYVDAYVLTVTNGEGDGEYAQGTVVNITADVIPGKTFSSWSGDVTYVADTGLSSTTITMPAEAQTVVATYTDNPTYSLTVNNGTGSGSYWEGYTVTVSADDPPANQIFNEWTGDTSTMANTAASITTLTMPASAATISATYTTATIYTVATNGLADYTTVQDAFDAVITDDISAIIRIMDSGIYNEYVTLGTGVGADGNTIYLQAAEGETPTLYGIELLSRTAVVVDGITFDGNLRDYSDPGSGRQYSLVSTRRYASHKFENCTFKGRGYTRVMYIAGNANTLQTIRNCVFEADTYRAVELASYGDNLGSVLIENNRFEGTDYAIYRARKDLSGTQTIQYNVFDGRNGMYAGLYAHLGGTGPGPVNVTVANNTFYEVGYTSDLNSGAVLIRDASDDAFGAVVKDNLIVGDGTAGNYYGLKSYLFSPVDIDANYNGFYNVYQQIVARLDTAKTVTELNAYASAGNNVVSDIDPFTDAANGDFSLKSGTWATTAGSNGGYIGALPPPRPMGTLLIID